MKTLEIQVSGSKMADVLRCMTRGTYRLLRVSFITIA